nr:hypothetical protein [Paenibacillus larvae]
MSYYLGLDAGGTKTYAVIVDETGRVAGREEAVWVITRRTGPGQSRISGWRWTWPFKMRSCKK